MSARRQRRLRLPAVTGRPGAPRRAGEARFSAWLRLATVMAVAATVLGLGEGTAQADPNPIEDSFGNPAGGPWAVTWSEGQTGGTIDSCNNQQGDPVGDYTYVYPTALGAFGDHPVIVWGNGTSITGDDGTCSYEVWLRWLASWGFVVVAANSSWAGDGALLHWGGATTVLRNNDPADFFYQKLDTTSIGVAGHSQGAMGAANAALRADGLFESVTAFAFPSREWMELFITLPGVGVHLQADDLPSKAAMDGLDAPIFFLWGTEDAFAIYPTPLTGGPSTPEAQRTVNDWGPPTGPFAAGAIIGADHPNPFSEGAGYSIAWIHYTLACHAPAIPAFVTTGGTPAEITTNSGWRHVQRQGLTATC